MPTMTTEPEVMTADDVASYLRISKPTAWDIMRRADFPSLRIGKPFRVRREDFLRWVESQVVNREQATP
jgi:excisionase family DNA binding protein